jgi:hypothetical protein
MTNKAEYPTDNCAQIGYIFEIISDLGTLYLDLSTGGAYFLA